MLERFAHRALRNFVESDAANALRFGLGVLLGFFLFLLLGAVAEFFRQVRGDGFAFAVRVRREIDAIHAQRQLLQPGDNFFFAGNDDVFGLEIVVDIDTERALGQIFHVAERSLDSKALTQIFLDGLRLGRRLDDD